MSQDNRTRVIGKGLVNMVPQLRSEPLTAKVLFMLYKVALKPWNGSVQHSDKILMKL